MIDLEKGILFEDTNILLEWGKPILNLAKQIGADVITQPDRTIIEWGNHKILDGLCLDLSNTFLLKSPREFKSIEYKTSGDHESLENFKLIAQQLLNQFGSPTTKEGELNDISEKFWKWETSIVNISLILFEQHAYKLALSIEKNN